MDTLRHLIRSRLAIVGFALVAGILVCCAFGHWISPYDAGAFSAEQLRPPSARHPLGTDSYGTDILAMILDAGLRTARFALVTVLVAGCLGITLGVVAGFVGGMVDGIVSRLVEILMAFPVMVAALLVLATLGAGSEWALIMAISITLAPRFTRVMRGAVLPLRAREYVQAAEAIGCSRVRILGRHLLPNLVAPMVVLFSAYLPYVVLLEASLSFLGLGAPPDSPTWGRLVAEGRKFFYTAPWTVFFPGIAVTLLAIGFNLFGDGLRDATDPHGRRRVAVRSR